MFDSRGPEIDIPSQLALKKLLLSASNSYVLALIPATSFAGDGTHQLVTVMKEELQRMFVQPGDNLLIGIT